MNKKHLTVVYIIVFAVFVMLAIWGYNYFSSNNSPNTKVENAQKPPNISDDNPNGGNEDDRQAVKDEQKKSANPASDFVVLNYEGKEVTLSEKLGRPIVLNFWASWCPPCKNEFPHFQNAYNKYKDDVEFILVDLVDGQRETISKGKDFISQNNYTMPIYFDDNQSAAYAYRISSIPMTYFINRDGGIVNLYRGQISEKSLFSEIDALIDIE
ncbi:MAG: TlpA family protein disulfide reductase [Firmicutes bacterium]|nr:TlpA family protein disulfide reductase [Bacillota bacterium]